MRSLFASPTLRLPRPTIRLRLTVFYGLLFLISGAALLAITYLLVRFTFPTASIHTYTSTQPASAGPPHPLAPPPSLASLQAQGARLDTESQCPRDRLG